LGRPIRDQVYTERSTEASMLQALELTNGPLLSERIRRAAASLLGLAKDPPQNIFDSKMVRSGPVPVDVEIKGAKDLWLLLEDVDTYDPARVIAGWADAVWLVNGKQQSVAQPTGEVQEKEGTTPVIAAKLPSLLHFRVPAGTTRFQARAVIDERSRHSDISPALRFFVFTEKPDPDRLIRVDGEAPSALPHTQWTSRALVERLYLHLLSRRPTGTEAKLAMEMAGVGQPKQAGVEDLLWALLVSPEFQFIH
jgi:hypothetical protein